MKVCYWVTIHTAKSQRNSIVTRLKISPSCMCSGVWGQWSTILHFVDLWLDLSGQWDPPNPICNYLLQKEWQLNQRQAEVSDSLPMLSDFSHQNEFQALWTRYSPDNPTSVAAVSNRTAMMQENNALLWWLIKIGWLIMSIFNVNRSCGYGELFGLMISTRRSPADVILEWMMI